MKMSKILNVAFYKFVALGDLPRRREELRDFCRELSHHGSSLGSSLGSPLRGTILLAPEGINAFLAGEEASVRRCLEHLRAMPEFSDLAVKESWSETIPFGRMLVKIKKEIIPM